MANPSEWVFSLNRDDILRRLQAREQLAEQIRQLQSKLIEEDSWIEAVKRIVPHELLSSVLSIEAAAEGPERASIWKSAVEGALQEAKGGLLPKDIATYIREQGSWDAKDRLIRNPNGIYTALGRMVDDGQVVKVGDKFYSPSLHAELSASGELESDANSPELTEVQSAVIQILEQFGPSKPKDISSVLPQYVANGTSVGSSHNVYNILPRMARKNLIFKSGQRYFLKSQMYPAADEFEGDGADMDSVGD